MLTKPERNDVLVNSKVTKTLSAELNKVADEVEISLAELIRQVLTEFIESRKTN